MAQATHAAFDTREVTDRRAAPGRPRAAAAAAKTDVETDLRLSIHGDLASVESEWRAFEQTADCTAFQSFDWLSTWQRQIGTRHGTVPAIVIGRGADGAILFLLPLAVERSGFARRLCWLGSGLCDYNAPLLAPDFPQQLDAPDFEPLWREIMLRLRSHPDLHFDLVHFEKMPETVGAQRNPFLGLDVVPHPSSAYSAALTEDWTTFYERKRPSSTRRNDRNRRKQMAARGEVRLISAERPAEVAATLETLIAQKSAWFARMGIANMFERPGYRDFFLDVANRDLVHVSCLAAGAQAAATNLGLRFRGRYYHVIVSYDEELARFSPGTLHLHELIRHAIGRGCHTFDFSIGDERYKREWFDNVLGLYDHAAPTTLRGALALAPIAAKRRVKHWLKNTPALWQAARKARAFVASKLG